jgi:hypothetical protein
MPPQNRKKQEEEILMENIGDISYNILYRNKCSRESAKTAGGCPGRRRESNGSSL